jgi:hypothetical protein
VTIIREPSRLNIGRGRWYDSREKTPPNPGWYNASRIKAPFVMRYWDGSQWLSTPLVASTAAEAKRSALRKVASICGPIYWRHLNSQFKASARCEFTDGVVRHAVKEYHEDESETS